MRKSTASGSATTSSEVLKAAEGVQRVAHMVLVRVQTRNDDEA